MIHLTSKSNKLISLRPPKNSDLNAIYNYALDLGNEDTFITLNPQEPVTLAEEKATLQQWIKDINQNNLVMYLAFDNQQLIGMAQVSRGKRRQRDHGHFGISLHHAYRHDGIGQQLARFVIHQAIARMNLRIIRLEVFASNSVAYHVYTKLGFVEYGRLPAAFKYKGQDETEILMYYRV